MHCKLRDRHEKQNKYVQDIALDILKRQESTIGDVQVDDVREARKGSLAWKI
jgi:hypothetical protein